MVSTSPGDLRTAVAAARARWPGLTVTEADLSAQLTAAGVAPAPEDVVARGAELALAHAAAAGDPVAVAVVERDVMTSSRATIHRYLRDEARTEEVVQQLRIHFLVGEGGLPRLARFDGRAPLGAWVSMCAARLALHALRKDRSRREVSDEWSDALAQLTANDAVVEPLRARSADAVANALREACLALPRRQRSLVRLLFVEGESVDDVAAIYQVHRVTIWRWLQEAQEALRDHVRMHLRRALPAGELDTGALVAWVEDQVMLSLDVVLAPTVTDLRR